jgi:hypothetical protein
MKIIDIGQETFYTPRNQETRLIMYLILTQKALLGSFNQILTTKNSWSHVNFPLMSGRPVTMIVQGYPFSQNI